MKRFLLLASLAAVAVSGVAAIPATDAGAVICKGKRISNKKMRVKCPTAKLRGPQGPTGPQGPAGPAGGSSAGAGFLGAFSLRGDAVIPARNLFAGHGFEFDGACSGAGNPEPSLEATSSNVAVSQIGQTTVGNANTNGVENDDADPGEADVNLDPGADDNVVNVLVVRPTNGNNSTLIYTLNGPEQGDDCRIDGIGMAGLNVSPTS